MIHGKISPPHKKKFNPTIKWLPQHAVAFPSHANKNFATLLTQKLTYIRLVLKLSDVFSQTQLHTRKGTYKFEAAKRCFKMSTTSRIPRRSPIQVLTRLNVVCLQWTQTFKVDKIWEWYHIVRFHGVMVSTQDSESCDPSSNLGGTWHFCQTFKQDKIKRRPRRDSNSRSPVY